MPEPDHTQLVTPETGERPPDELVASYFAIVPEWILAEPGDVVKLYALLDRAANKRRTLWPGQAELAEKMQCSDRQVRRHLTRLREIGALEVVKRRYNGTTIHVLHKDPPGHRSPERPDTGVLTDRTGGSGLSGHPSPPNQSHRTRAKEPTGEVGQVFEAWRTGAEKTGRTVLDDKRRRLITAALKDFPLDDVLDAVIGWKNSAFHRGENPERKVHNDLDLLLRNAANIERFRDYARSPRQSSKPTPATGPTSLTPQFDTEEEFEAWRASQ